MKSFLPVSLAAAAAVLAWSVPAASGALLYDRSAILQGDWWRLWTGHWIHFSVSHLAWNIAVLLGAGAWLERLQPGSLVRWLVAGAPLISLTLLVGEPAMQVYGGLSGLATGAVVLLALMQWDRRPRSRVWWGAGLALVALKLGVEAAQPAPLFAGFSGAVRPSVLAHAAGAALAAAFFLSRNFAASLPGRGPVAGASQP
jgi:rhomboid family GlyGly-CTERM serine protease